MTPSFDEPNLKTIATKETPQVTLVVKVTDDKLKLFVSAEPGPEHKGCRRSHLEEILVEIASAKLLHERVLDDIALLIARGEKVADRRVSKGVAPVPGDSGRVVLLVKPLSVAGEVSVDERGYANFRELHRFDNIRKGQIVGRVYPPTAGKTGVTVFNEALPANPGAPINVKHDKSITRRQAGDYEELHAEVQGYLSDMNGSLKMCDHLVIAGDVAMHTGNIDFIGTVVVQGDIAPGFTVRGRLGVELNGGGTHATIESAEGGVKVKGVLRGKSRVVCREDLEIAVGHELRAEVAGRIVVLKELLDAEVQTQQTVEAGKAVVVGGVLRAVCGVEAGELGNSVGQRTEIELLSDIAASREFQDLIERIGQHDKAIELVDAHLGPVGQDPARLARLPEKQQHLMQQLRAKRQALADSRVQLLAKQKSLLTDARIQESVRVNFVKLLGAGVEVIGGKERHVVFDPRPGPGSIVFSLQTATFSYADYAPLSCNLVLQRDVGVAK